MSGQMIGVIPNTLKDACKYRKKSFRTAIFAPNISIDYEEKEFYLMIIRHKKDLRLLVLPTYANERSSVTFADFSMLSISLFHGLLDILQQILAGFEADAKADGGVGYRHLGTLFWGEEAENGRGGMDG